MTTQERKETIVGSVVLLVILGLIAWAIWAVWTMTLGSVFVLAAVFALGYGACRVWS